jgi:hypothetical protein
MADHSGSGTGEGRARVDREQAFQFWASLPVDKRSYAAVARKFDVSPRTVERYARDGRWRERLRGIELDAAARADEKLGRDRAKQLADFHQLIEASCVTYARQLASGHVKITAAFADRPRGWKTAKTANCEKRRFKPLPEPNERPKI